MPLNGNYMLSDRSIVPSEEYLLSLTGDKMILWNKVTSFVSENYRDISGVWNYYNDGKQWLHKLSQKKKTIFWAAVVDSTFRISLYFTDKAAPLIEESDLPTEIKENFKTARKSGLIKAATVKLNELSDVANVLILVKIKMQLK